MKARIEITEEEHPILGKVLVVRGGSVKVRRPFAQLQRPFKSKKIYRRDNRPTVE